MACYKPLAAWLPYAGTAKGPNPPYFGRRRKLSDLPISLKCGQCIGCRLDRSREWAIRCHHESELHDSKCFLTLTYANDPVSLIHRHFQLFMKRLRKQLPDLSLMYYMAGEYGNVYDHHGNKIPGRIGRPHFHCILFGYDFPDRTPFKRSPSGVQIYNSEFLDRIWQHGHAGIQDFNLAAAAYVARYVTKKITGDAATRHYEKVSPDGEIISIEPEYNRMSLKPAIGKRWIERYPGDVYPKDFVTHKGEKFRPPKYYDKYFEGLCPEEMEALKLRRREVAMETKIAPERLEQMHQHKKLTSEKLVRTL